MSVNKSIWSLSNFSDSQNYQVQPKSRINSKRYRKSLILQSSNRPRSSNCNTSLTADGFASEDQCDFSKVTMDQTLDTKDKSETMKLFFDNENSNSEAIPFQAFRSTLANLSDALATLDEGEFLRWDTHNSPLRTPAPSIKPADRVPTMLRTQFSVRSSLQELSGGCGSNRAEMSPPKLNEDRSNRTNRLRESMEVMSRKSTFRMEGSREMSNSGDNVTGKPQQTNVRIKNIDTSFAGFIRESSEQMSVEISRSKDRKRSIFQQNKKRSTSIYNENMAEKENRVSRKARAEAENRGVSGGKAAPRHMYKDDHYKITKLNLGEQGFRGFIKQEGNESKIKEMFEKTIVSRTWNAGKTLAGFQIQKKKKRDYSISKSLSRPDAFTKTEKVPLKARVNTFERFEPEEDCSVEGLIIRNDLTRSVLNQEQVSSKAERVLIGEMLNQDKDDSFSMSFDARKTIIGLTGAHFLQKLVPSLKIKKDILPRRKTGASGLGEIDMSSSMTVENVEKVMKTPDRTSSNFRDKNRGSLERAKVTVAEQTKGNMLIEDRLKVLEEKYTGKVGSRQSYERSSHNGKEEMMRKGKIAVEAEKQHRLETSFSKQSSKFVLLSNEARKKVRAESFERRYMR